ncbi:hypothetical protein ABPG74_005640 [Tetrahymena malaccensis]
MDQNEKVSYEKLIQQYIEDQKLPDLFESYTKQLILNQPADPIQFLIDHISSKRSQRLIFFTGSTKEKRKEVVDQIANAFNYEVINLEDDEQLKSKKSEIVNQNVKTLISKVEKHFRGVIVNGYPYDFETAIFAQQNGIIPDRVFVFSSSHDDLKAHYSQVYKDNQELVERAITRDSLNQKEIRQMYNGFHDYFNVSSITKQELTENIKSILKLKDKRIVPLRSPRVLIIRPPHLRQRAHQLYQQIAQKYGFNAVSIYELLDKHIQQKTHIGKFVYQAMKNHSKIPDEIIIGLLRAQILNTSSKQRGYVVEGFPKCQSQLKSIQTYAINPHFIIILDDEDENLLNQYKLLKVDPETGRYYEAGDSSQTNQVIHRLKAQQKQDQQWIDEIVSYKELIGEAEKQFGEIAQRYKLNIDSNEKIIKSVDVFLNNPKIYS